VYYIVKHTYWRNLYGGCYELLVFLRLAFGLASSSFSSDFELFSTVFSGAGFALFFTTTPFNPFLTSFLGTAVLGFDEVGGGSCCTDIGGLTALVRAATAL
jgi:hypothetical protein